MTRRDANGNRLCPTCGATLGINLGSQRRHDADVHAEPLPCPYCGHDSHVKDVCESDLGEFGECQCHDYGDGRYLGEDVAS